MELKKGQFAVFDLALMLLFIFTTYFIFQQDMSGISLDQSRSYDESQILSFLSNQDEYIYLVFTENLSNPEISENWTNISLLSGLSTDILYLKLGNLSESKYIFSCDAQVSLTITRDFYIDNLSLDLRYVDFGVCK